MNVAILKKGLTKKKKILKSSQDCVNDFNNPWKDFKHINEGKIRNSKRRKNELSKNK